jgi:hypothetical protein
MKQNKTLSAVKRAITKAGEVEVVLSDVTKSSLNEIVTSAINAYDAGIKKAELIYSTAESLASALGTEPTYERGRLNSITLNARSLRAVRSALKAQNLLTEVRKTMLSAFNLDKPRAKSRTAEANAKARAEFADAPVAKLQAEKVALAKNGDAQSLKRAVKIQAEIEKRAKPKQVPTRKRKARA